MRMSVSAISTGITCRWASKHSEPDELTRVHLIEANTAAAASGNSIPHMETNGERQTAAAEAEPAVSTVSEVPPLGGNAVPQQAEDATWAAGSGGGAVQRSSEVATAAAAGASDDTAGVSEFVGQSPMVAELELTPAQPAARAVGAAGSDGAWLNGQSAGSAAAQSAATASNAAGSAQTLLPPAVELPVHDETQKSVNVLDKGVQSDLR